MTSESDAYRLQQTVQWHLAVDVVTLSMLNRMCLSTQGGEGSMQLLPRIGRNSPVSTSRWRKKRGWKATKRKERGNLMLQWLRGDGRDGHWLLVIVVFRPMHLTRALPYVTDSRIDFHYISPFKLQNFVTFLKFLDRSTIPQLCGVLNSL